jgi:hypothetical protein
VKFLNVLRLKPGDTWSNHKALNGYWLAGYKVPADLSLRGRLDVLKFVVGSFRLDYVLVTEGSILDPCCEIQE